MDNRLRRHLVFTHGRTDGFRAVTILTVVFLIGRVLGFQPASAAPVQGWLSWRGPEQSGVSRETGLPEKVSMQDALWVADFPGKSAPVIANGKLYAMGYRGSGADLQEGIACFDAESGQKLWEHLYNDYL